MRSALAAVCVLLIGMPSLGCASESDDELIWEGTAPLTADTEAAIVPGQRSWSVDLQLEPPLALRKGRDDTTTYAVLVRLPKPIGTEDEVIAAVMELVPETAARRAPPLAVAGKETSFKRTLRASAVTRVTMRVTTKGDGTTELAGPATVSFGGAKCISRLADEWQANQFGIEPVPLANSSDCVRR
jgi:hypothetical protein